MYPSLCNHQYDKRSNVRHRAAGLIHPAGVADGVVEVWPGLGFLLGLEQVADGTEAVGAAVTGLRGQPPGRCDNYHFAAGQ